MAIASRAVKMSSQKASFVGPQPKKAGITLGCHQRWEAA